MQLSMPYEFRQNKYWKIHIEGILQSKMTFRGLHFDHFFKTPSIRVKWPQQAFAEFSWYISLPKRSKSTTCFVQC